MSIVKVHSQNRGLKIAKTALDKINLRFFVTSVTFEILKCLPHIQLIFLNYLEMLLGKLNFFLNYARNSTEIPF